MLKYLKMTELSLACIYQQMRRIRDFFARKNGKRILSAKHFGYKVFLPKAGGSELYRLDQIYGHNQFN